MAGKFFNSTVTCQWDSHWAKDRASDLRIGQETVLALSAGMVKLPIRPLIGMWLFEFRPNWPDKRTMVVDHLCDIVHAFLH
jgi:hypothetical protein